MSLCRLVEEFAAVWRFDEETLRKILDGVQSAGLLLNFLLLELDALELGGELPLVDHPQGWSKRKRELADGTITWMTGPKTLAL